MLSRTSMFKPDTPKIDLLLKNRELQILYTVGLYKYMTATLCSAINRNLVGTPLVHALEGARRKGKIRTINPPTGRPAIAEIMKKLFHYGYLDRPPIQKQMRWAGGSHEMIYALTEKGRRALEDVKPTSTDHFVQHRRKYQMAHILHELMIARFRATISLAIQNHSPFQMSFWRVGNDLRLELSQNGTNQMLIPDGFFAIRNGDQEEHFFVEADRSTMPLTRPEKSRGTSWDRKIAKYEEYHRSGIHKREFQTAGFRVLTITPSEKRRDNIREIASQSQLRSAFYIASEDHFDPHNPQSVLEGIWVTGKQEQQRALI